MKGARKGRIVTSMFVLLWAGSLSLAASDRASQATAMAPASTDAAARGKYLVEGIGCTDCHTPAKMSPNGLEPDETRLLSGHQQAERVPPPPPSSGPWIGAMAATRTAWSSPMGVSYSANLTPDPETGLGKWTEQQFVETIRNGRHQGRGRQLLPPMPWQAFRNLSDDDLKAIFAYLRSIPAIKNQVPPPVTATPPGL